MRTPDSRRLIERFPALKSLVKSPLGQYLVQTTRGARVVREPLRFAALQLRPSRVAGYRLRRGELRIFVRHGTRDVHILNEIFGGTGARDCYEPPLAVARALAGNPAPKILDLGANVGLFGAYALHRWPGAEIQSFEPDPTNLRMLGRLIADNELERRWSVTPAAVAGSNGEMSFESGLLADSHLLAGSAGARAVATQGSRVEAASRTITVRATDLFEQDHDVHLMKMDIEGGEWPILSDPRFARLKADVLVLEWHARGCPEQDARAAALRMLGEGGYTGVEEIASTDSNGVLWAWRENVADAPEPESRRRAIVRP